MSWSDIFPITDSIWSTFVILSTVLAVPLLMSRIRFPQIAGLIITGILIGPGGLDLVRGNETLDFFSKVGLLLIMFFAGLEIDVEEMKRTRTEGLAFGLITFFIPFILCLAILTPVLGTGGKAVAVTGCILGSHTLISYPVISRHGLGKRKSVAISVSGALTAIVLALTIYAFVQSGSEGSIFVRIAAFALKTAVYVTFIIMVYPRTTRKFFRKVHSSNSHFLFILALLAMSCGLSALIGLENILGAFLAGLVLNRYIPKTSPLMNRLDFTGNTLFIPLFLLNTGMLIHPSSLFANLNVLEYFAVMFAIATAGKWAAAFAIQKVTGMDRADRMIIFGLSESHAAGTLAMAMGAYSMGILDDAVLGTMVLIVLFSCIISNIATEAGAKRILRSETDEKDIVAKESILVCLSGASTMQAVMDTSIAVRRSTGSELVGIHITVGENHTREHMSTGKDILLKAQTVAAAAEIPFVMQNRIGSSITSSIVHAAGEFESTQIVTGLPASENLSMGFYENLIRPLVDSCSIQISFVRLSVPFNTIRRIVVLVTGPIVQDRGFEKNMESVKLLGDSIGCATEFCGKDSAIDAVRGTGFVFSSGKVSYKAMGETADMNMVINDIRHDHLLVIVGHRNVETHAGRMFMHLYERLHMMKQECSIMLIFPEAERTDGKQLQTPVRTDRDLLKAMRM